MAHARWKKKNPTKVKALSARYYYRHRTAVRGKHGAWYAKNKESHNVRVARRTKENQPRVVQRQREWRLANPDKQRSYQKRYRAANPERSRVNGNRRRARLLGVTGSGITTVELRMIAGASLGLCSYCNERRPLTLDHIEPLSLGGAHEPDNATMACRRCNSSKCDTPLAVWLAKRAA